MGKAYFLTEQCIHWRGSNLFCLLGNVRGVVEVYVLRHCNSREFATANIANIPRASVDTAAACVRRCHNRFPALFRGSVEK